MPEEAIPIKTSHREWPTTLDGKPADRACVCVYVTLTHSEWEVLARIARVRDMHPHDFADVLARHAIRLL
jgi:hypothetical protein